MDREEVKEIVREMIPEILEAVKYPISEHALLKLPEVMGAIVKKTQARALFIEQLLKEHPQFLVHKELILHTVAEYQGKYPFREIENIVTETDFIDEIKKRIEMLKTMGEHP